jgi:fumarate hydratase subunit alpha
LDLNLLENTALQLIEQAAIIIPEDVKAALKNAYVREHDALGKEQLKIILENIELAEKEHVPVCQDTGTVIFYVRAGAQAGNLHGVLQALMEATRKATRLVPLRPNAVHPFTGRNSGDNTGKLVPCIHWEIMPGKRLELTVMLKGGGSENVSAVRMLLPSEGLNAVKKFVVDSVVSAGATPCPPTLIGVAVGGGADVAMELAKKTLLRPVGSVNPDPEAAKLEKELLKAVNMTEVGPMGLGGKTTALSVHVDYAHRHPASYPAAVAFSCWACRRASASIDENGHVEPTVYGGKK